MNTRLTAPGPRGELLVGNLREFRRDVVGLMLRSAREYGDVVRFHLGPFVVHLLNHPDHVEHVLQSGARNYDKATRSSAKIRAISGDSLLTSNGELWMRQRRLMQPSFHRQRIAGMAAEMIGFTDAMLERWQTHLANGEALDIAAEMMRLTYSIVGKTLLGADVGGGASAIERTMETLLTHTYRRWGSLVDVPAFLPTPGNLRFRRALKAVDQIVYRIIAEHRANGGMTNSNLLSILLQVRDEQTGEGLSDSELRNETITFLLAGHETTANALAWTFYLLSQNPDVERQLRVELSTVLSGRSPTVEDLPRLTFLAVIVRRANQGTIQLRSTSAGKTRDLVVKGWSGLMGGDWSGDGRSLFTTSHTHEGDSTLLNVTLDGSVSVLLHSRNEVFSAIPSPDGRSLAITEDSGAKNVWQIENF